MKIDSEGIEILDFADIDERIMRYAMFDDNEGKLIVDYEDHSAMFFESLPVTDRIFWKEKGYGYVGGHSSHITARIYENGGSTLKKYTVLLQGFTPYATDIFESNSFDNAYTKAIGYKEHFDQFDDAIQHLLDVLNYKIKIDLPEPI